MPDNDRWPKHLPRKWRAFHRAMCDANVTDAKRGRELAKALAASLRDTNGVPDLTSIVDRAAEQCRPENGQLALMDCFSVPAQTYITPADPQSRIAAEIARAIVATQAQEIAAGGRPAAESAIVRRVLESAVDRFYAHRALPLAVANGVATAEEFRRRLNAAGASAGLPEIATQLVNDPTARHIRAPSVPRVPVLTVLHAPWQQVTRGLS